MAATYANDYLGNAVVAEENGSLVLKLGPDGAKSRPLTHFDRDLFIYYPTRRCPTCRTPVTFGIGPDQKASQVTIEDFNDDGQGVLGARAVRLSFRRKPKSSGEAPRDWVAA